jgi:hypothetical protein
MIDERTDRGNEEDTSIFSWRVFVDYSRESVEGGCGLI